MLVILGAILATPLSKTTVNCHNLGVSRRGLLPGSNGGPQIVQIPIVPYDGGGICIRSVLILRRYCRIGKDRV